MARRGHGADGSSAAYVLRRSVPAGVLAWTRREDEHRHLAALAGRGLPVPTVYGTGTLGRSYVLMGRLPGAVAGRLEPETATALSRELGGWLARLHALTPAELGLEADGSAREATLREIAAWQGRYEDARPGPVPLLGALLAWAERAVPDDGRAPVLVWGDPGPHNALVDDGHVSGLLDWELAHLGHPLEDLGAAVWACLGRFDAEALVAGLRGGGGAGRPIGARLLRRARLDHADGDDGERPRGVARRVGDRAVDRRARARPGRALARPRRAGRRLGRAAAARRPAARAPLWPDAGAAVAGLARWLAADVVPTVQAGASGAWPAPRRRSSSRPRTGSRARRSPTSRAWRRRQSRPERAGRRRRSARAAARRPRA